MRYLIIFQAIVAAVAGLLISSMSWVGKMGINIAYKEYAVLKSWWKVAIILFAIQLLLILIQWLLTSNSGKRNKGWMFLFLALGIMGLVITYHDFQNTLSHKLLKEKFRSGVYLFWLGWLVSSVFFLTKSNKILAIGNKNTVVTKI
ncbi:hypothetical protein [Olivibacter sitiensis]|uniref:hypothetical protein n=1 Tax=Olivibacter sitiensis TaxID=376470 RepID=UPI00056B9328|nr:hypothetical protein [Olivibacter sitiensis]